MQPTTQCNTKELKKLGIAINWLQIMPNVFLLALTPITETWYDRINQ